MCSHLRINVGYLNMIRHRHALPKYLDKLLLEGRIVFISTEAETALGI